eukprot:766283-Hanusia_phi.AAC.5
MVFNSRKSSKRTKQTTVKGPWGKDEDDVVIKLGPENNAERGGTTNWIQTSREKSGQKKKTAF